MKKKKHLILLILLFICSVILWNFQITRLLLFPVNIFATYVHEFGHALMAIITGGTVHSIEVSPDGSGLTTTSGGVRFLVASGGYLGSTLIGAIMLVFSLEENSKISKYFLVFINLVLIMCLIFFARDLFTIIATIFFVGVVFLLVAKASNIVCQWFLCFISIQCCFYSIYNLNVLLGLSLQNHMQNDAAAMQNITMIPAPVWSVLWIVMSFIIFVFVLKLVWKSD